MRAAEDTRLDHWLPEPVVRTHHRRAVAAAPDDLWRAANGVRLSDTRTLGRLVRWRIPGLDGALTYGELFRAYPFTVVDEGEHHLLAGLCGRIWTPARDYPRLEGPDDFARWDEPGTVRVLFGHWVEEAENGSALVSEARVEPVDGTASLRLRTLWKVIGPFERLVGAEAIARATEISRRM
jgi:hypothetical protein